MRKAEVVTGVECLRRFMVATLGAVGVPEADATVTADCLLEAELDGVATHGVVLLPTYCGRIRAGLTEPHARIRVVRDAGAVALIDGSNGLGPVVAWRAMAIAMEKAARLGVGLAAVRESNHFGAAGVYARHASAEGRIGIVVSNSSPDVLTPGSTAKFLGTNPIAVALPTASDPVLIDMATSQVSWGRIRQAAERGDRLPEGWAVDESGEPTRDPIRALSGGLLPLGGGKGFALGVMVEALGGVLSGGAVGPEVAATVSAQDRPARVGHCMIAIEPAMVAEGFAERMERLATSLRRLPAGAGSEPPRAPGDRRTRHRADARVQGIRLSQATAAALDDLADTLHVHRLDATEDR